MNEWIDLREYNVVFSIKYGKENSVEFYSDLIPMYSDKFIYDRENNKVRGAKGYCILSHDEHKRLLNEQSKGFELRYDDNGQIITYKKKPVPENIKFYKIDYDYRTETWIETATEKEKAKIDYDEYLLLDTPRYNRLMTQQNLISNYDEYLNSLSIFLDDSGKTMKILPIPSKELENFKNKVLSI